MHGQRSAQTVADQKIAWFGVNTRQTTALDGEARSVVGRRRAFGLSIAMIVDLTTDPLGVGLEGGLYVAR